MKDLVTWVMLLIVSSTQTRCTDAEVFRPMELSNRAVRQLNDPDIDRWIWSSDDYVPKPVTVQFNIGASNITESNATESNVIPSGTILHNTTGLLTSNIKATLDFAAYELPAASDPCEFYNPPLPDFKAPSPRISELKCYQYIWDNKVRLERQKLYNKCLVTTNKPRPTILNGTAVEGFQIFSEFPHMGAVGWKTTSGGLSFKCGGSLISEKFVLSAAHCTKASHDAYVINLAPDIVRLGDSNVIASEIDGKIMKIIIHPEYKPPKKYNDIALFELEFDVKFSFVVQPACLWSNPDEYSMTPTANVTAWGFISTSNDAGSDNRPVDLQYVELDIINTTLCDKLLTSICSKRTWCGLQDQICAAKLVGGADSCQGASGGPIQRRIPISNVEFSMNYVYGVTSFGRGCGLPNTPGVYIKVSSFVDWIESIVWR